VNKKTGAIDRIYFDNDSLIFADNNQLFEWTCKHFQKFDQNIWLGVRILCQNTEIA
jgi:hypothetical protein